MQAFGGDGRSNHNRNVRYGGHSRCAGTSWPLPPCTWPRAGVRFFFSRMGRRSGSTRSSFVLCTRAVLRRPSVWPAMLHNEGYFRLAVGPWGGNCTAVWFNLADRGSAMQLPPQGPASQRAFNVPGLVVDRLPETGWAARRDRAAHLLTSPLGPDCGKELGLVHSSPPG